MLNLIEITLIILWCLMKKTVENRFWGKVDISDVNECWIWKAYSQGRNGNKYGRFGYNGKLILAHRLSWILKYGDPGDMYVLHKCDNTLCVNPNHLFLGTHNDNMKDKVSKNRQSRMPGTTHPMSKLTDNDVFDIRRRLSKGETLKSISQTYDIHISTVGYIKTRKLWKHI